MKNYLMLALLLGAVTTMAFGQVGVSDAAKISVACPDDECHVTQMFMGQGGFIGEVASGFSDVSFVVSCGTLSTSGTVSPDKGTVAQLLTDDNGLSCHAEGGGTVEVHGVQDGAWYWITDDMNTAVATLLPKDALDNPQATVADPGSADISVTAGPTASFVKQLSTGRVGIISHILPDPPAPTPEICGGRRSSRGVVSEVTTNCMMGDGGTHIVLTGPTTGGISGGQAPVVVGDSVHRNASTAAGGDYDITAALWGNGTGHVSTAGTPLHGWNIHSSATPLAAAYAAGVGNAVPGTANDLAEANVAITAAGVITISPSANYCGPGKNEVAMITIQATPGANAVLPAIAVDSTTGVAASRTLRVFCPGSAANQGQELVPDSPFPTTE